MYMYSDPGTPDIMPGEEARSGFYNVVQTQGFYRWYNQYIISLGVPVLHVIGVSRRSRRSDVDRFLPVSTAASRGVDDHEIRSFETRESVPRSVGYLSHPSPSSSPYILGIIVLYSYKIFERHGSAVLQGVDPRGPGITGGPAYSWTVSDDKQDNSPVNNSRPDARDRRWSSGHRALVNTGFTT